MHHTYTHREYTNAYTYIHIDALTDSFMHVCTQRCIYTYTHRYMHKYIHNVLITVLLL